MSTLTYVLGLLVLLSSANASAETISVNCNSEDEGQFAAEVAPRVTRRQLYFDGQIGTMRNGEVSVSPYLSARKKGGHVDGYELTEITLQLPNNDTLRAAAGNLLVARDKQLLLSVGGPGIDPEGIDCSIRVK